jgi:hypothetical protein
MIPESMEAVNMDLIKLIALLFPRPRIMIPQSVEAVKMGCVIFVPLVGHVSYP